MKNNIIRMLTIMLAISIVFTACNKDTSLTKQMQNPNKSNETMSIDSAVWYIEAALNYTYCEITSSEIIGVDSVFITVNVNDENEINFNDLTSAFNEFETSLLNALGDNNLRLADIELVESSEKGGGITLKTSIIINPISIDPSSFNFYSNAYWYPVLEQGKCGEYEGEKKINSKVNYYLPAGYATDVESIYAGMYNNTYPDYFWSGPSDDCLNPDEMNYWLEKGREVADILKPSSKEFISCNYYYDGVGGTKSTTWYHMADFSFAIWHAK